jgi:hypothetical protein
MKALFCLAAALALAVGFSLTAPDRANAGCAIWSPCAPVVLVPTPHPIPLRKIRVRRAPCGVGCAPVVAAPAPCVTGCGRVAVAPVAPCVAPCGTASFWYQPTRFYAYWAQPAFTACYPGPGNCYWRRDCWYDSFGRRFCS